MTNRLIQRANCDYSLVTGVNISSLVRIAKSPKHYRYGLTHGYPEKKPMRLGTAAHAATLEPMRFQTEFVVWDKRTAGGKMSPRTGNDWEAFEEAHTGQTIITPDEYSEAVAIAEAIRGDRLAMQYLGEGDPEVTIQWTDDDTGIVCKGRIDWDVYRPQVHKPCIVDLKTARDVGSWGFCGSASKLDYHTRLAWYADGYEKATGFCPEVVVVAVESSPPYDVVCYSLEDEPELDAGRDEYRRMLDTLKQCQESGEWPGQGNGIMQRFQLAKWKQNNNEDIDGLGLDWTGT